MLKDKKGFTLVELLATVTILGILSTIAIVSVSGLLEKGRNEHYKTAEKQMIQAAQSYAQQNRGALPKTINGSSNVQLNTLITNKYIQPIKDHTDKVCSNSDLAASYVTIKKTSQTNYSYQAYLKCGKYVTS